MATNRCPCGYHNSVLKECSCTSQQVQGYLSKISGPLLDRIDLHVDVPEVKYKELTGKRDGEPSAVIAERVSRARMRQMEQFASDGILCNAQMGPRQLEEHCRLDAEASKQLEAAIVDLGFSARAYDRILKVARTIADLAGSESVQADHVAEAIQYRSLDRTHWNCY